MEKSKDKEKIASLIEDINFLEAYVGDIFSFMPAPLAFVSVRGVILEANPAFISLSEFTPEEIIGEDIERIFKHSKIQELIKITLKSDTTKGAKITFSPKGNKNGIPVQIFAKVRQDKEKHKLGVFLSLFDLTDIEKVLKDVKQARDDAEEERNKTVAIIQNFADGLLVFDENDILLSVNPQVKVFFKTDVEKLIGKSINDLSRIKEFEKLIGIFKGKKVFRKEFKVRNNLVLEITTIPIVSGSKNQGILVILHDITRESLIEKMKSEFVSLAAHQLRTPLSAIKWITKMLLDEELGKINKKQEEFLKDSYSANERMIILIKSLLNITEIEEGRYIFKQSSVDIEKIIKNVIGLYKEEAKRAGLKIQFKGSKERISKITIDAKKIQIAIDNLINNAIRYTLKGGRIIVSLKRGKGKLEFSIKDTGVGIPEEQQKRIFTKFFRASNVIKIETEGSGLGLYIVKNIIEAHGGKIWFKSEENKGTTFNFTLPIKQKL